MAIYFKSFNNSQKLIIISFISSFSQNYLLKKRLLGIIRNYIKFQNLKLFN